jgi:hypothetical protein
MLQMIHQRNLFQLAGRFFMPYNAPDIRNKSSSTPSPDVAGQSTALPANDHIPGLLERTRSTRLLPFVGSEIPMRSFLLH